MPVKTESAARAARPAGRTGRRGEGRPGSGRIGAVMSWWFGFARDLCRERTFTTKEVGIVHDMYEVPHLTTSASADAQCHVAA